MEPGQVIDVVKASGLRGRAAPGSRPDEVGLRAKDSPKPKYVVCNADEASPAPSRTTC